MHTIIDVLIFRINEGYEGDPLEEAVSHGSDFVGMGCVVKEDQKEISSSGSRGSWVSSSGGVFSSLMI